MSISFHLLLSVKTSASKAHQKCPLSQKLPYLYEFKVMVLFYNIRLHEGIFFQYKVESSTSIKVTFDKKGHILHIYSPSQNKDERFSPGSCPLPRQFLLWEQVIGQFSHKHYALLQYTLSHQVIFIPTVNFRRKDPQSCSKSLNSWGESLLYCEPESLKEQLHEMS